MRQIIILFILLIIFNLNALDKFSDSFLDKSKYGWDNHEKYTRVRTDKLARQNLLQIYDLKKQNILDNALKSTILPGLGQLSVKHYAKGQILMGTEIFLIGSFLYYNDKYLTEYDNYKKATYIGDIQDFHKKANEYHATSRAIIGLGVAVWLYGIFDSVLTTTDYNQDIWESLYKDYQRKKVVFSPTGITLRF
jgi:hypothetical protein